MAVTVLLVEDDELLRDMYSIKLEMEGFTVYTAADGQSGLEVANKHRPDVMVLDNIMPRLSGLDLFEKYLAQHPDHHPLVLFLSNKSSLADINRAKQLGAADYLLKSRYTPRALVTKIQELLGPAPA